MKCLNCDHDSFANCGEPDPTVTCETCRTSWDGSVADTCPECQDAVELTGDDLPYHLQLDAPPLGQCNRCKRQTWSPGELGTEDRMTQPDGNPCGGRIVAA